MDEETLAPMADALSATLAVIVLLICFFILGQVVAVSKQVDVKDVGAIEYVRYTLNLDFEEPEVRGSRLLFNRSFALDENQMLINGFLKKIKEECLECTSFKVISNYPQVGISLKRAKRAALANAIKLIPSMAKMGMDYEIALANDGNTFFVQIEGVK